MKNAGLTRFFRLLLPLVMFSLAAACAPETLNESFVSEPYVRERWLPFVVDGKTERDEIIRTIGEPTSSFQSGTILGYRLILVEGGKDVSEKEYRDLILNRDSAYLGGAYGWVNNRRLVLSEKGTLLTVREQNKEDKLLEILSREAEYSLVLVFDYRGILVRHNFRRIMP